MCFFKFQGDVIIKHGSAKQTVCVYLIKDCFSVSYSFESPPFTGCIWYVKEIKTGDVASHKFVSGGRHIFDLTS